MRSKARILRGRLDEPGASADTVSGGNHSQCIMGFASADVLAGNNANDYLNGGDGDDTLFGNTSTGTTTGARRREHGKPTSRAW